MRDSRLLGLTGRSCETGEECGGGDVQGMPRAEGGGPQLRRHGDEVQRLPGGYYRALGRTDDTMNLGGIKVHMSQPSNQPSLNCTQTCNRGCCHVVTALHCVPHKIVYMCFTTWRGLTWP